MAERTCTKCRFFTPAQTWVEPPAWGHCTKALARARQQDAHDAPPVFTWSDGTCEDFDSHSQSVPCG